MKRGATGRKRRRRSNPPAAAASSSPRRRRRRSRSSSSSTSHRRRRRNPPGMSLSPKGIARQIVQGAKDASGVLLGKASARAIPTMFNLPQAGVLGLGVQLGVALLTGFAAHKAAGRDYGRMVMAGGISAPLETFIVSKNIPFLAPALSPNQATVALGAYASQGVQMGRYADRALLSSYARTQALSSYNKSSGASYQDGDY